MTSFYERGQENFNKDYVLDVKNAGFFLLRVTADSNKFLESISLNHDGSINKGALMDNAGRTLFESARRVNLDREN